jgi:hypothetical protein
VLLYCTDTDIRDVNTITYVPYDEEKVREGPPPGFQLRRQRELDRQS